MSFLKQCFAAAAAAAMIASAQAEAPLAPAPGAEISLSVTVSRSVANDEAVASFSITRQGKTAKEAQAKLIADLNPGMKALRAAVPEKAAEFQTGQFYTNANYAPRKAGEQAKIVSWTSRQTVTVTLKDTAYAGPLIEAAAPHFEFSGLSFQVSREASRRNRSELMAEVLDDLAAKAAVIARGMNVPQSEVKLSKLDFGNTGSVGARNYRPVRMMAMAKAAPEAALDSAAVSAGESDVELLASAVFTVGEKPASKKAP